MEERRSRNQALAPLSRQEGEVWGSRGQPERAPEATVSGWLGRVARLRNVDQSVFTLVGGTGYSVRQFVQ